MQELHGRIRKWGNSLGILIPKAEARRLGLHAGDEVDLLIDDKRAVAPPLPVFDFGDWNPVDDHDGGWEDEGAP